MSVNKKGNKYQVTYRCNGKIINEYYDTEEAARIREAVVHQQKVQGTLIPPTPILSGDDTANFHKNITVSQMMDIYVQRHGYANWSANTLSLNLQKINDYIIPYIGDIQIRSLTTSRLETYYNNLLRQPAKQQAGKPSANISPSVVEKVHAIIRNALNEAIRWDYLRGVNPANNVKLPKYRKSKRGVWDLGEAKLALECCKDPILKLCLLLAITCTMRIGEILGLTWDCVHLDDSMDDPYLVVKKELSRCSKAEIKVLSETGRDDIFFTFPECFQKSNKTSLVLKTPKTEYSNRKIYLPTTMVSYLQQVQVDQLNLKHELGDEYQDYNLVVAQNNGRPFERRIISKRLKEQIRDNDLRQVVFHSLRHSSTSLKLKLSDGDIKAVQGDSGHSQANMVTDVYAEIMDGPRKELAKKMDHCLFDAPRPSPVADELSKFCTANPEAAKALLALLRLQNNS